jgi:DNA-3-methyladenine glycosylase II
VHSIQPETLNPSFAADSLINGVGTVSALQKRRLSATLEPQLPAVKQKKGKGKTTEKRAEQETEEALFAVPAIPTTPNKRRRPASATTSVAPPLSTPTPSAVNLIADNNPNPVTPEKPANSRRRRKVDPHATNAPLQTPGGSRLTSYPSSIFDSGSQTPSASQQSDSLTTENVLERACAHLVSVDPRLKTVIDKHHCRLFSPEGLAEEVDPFIALASSIIGQQVRC